MLFFTEMRSFCSRRKTRSELLCVLVSETVQYALSRSTALFYVGTRTRARRATLALRRFSSYIIIYFDFVETSFDFGATFAGLDTRNMSAERQQEIMKSTITMAKGVTSMEADLGKFTVFGRAKLATLEMRSAFQQGVFDGVLEEVTGWYGMRSGVLQSQGRSGSSDSGNQKHSP